MIKTIIELALELLKLIPKIEKWIKKTPTDKIMDKQKSTREKIDELKKSGRPNE